MAEQKRTYCYLMSQRRIALLKGDERLAAQLWAQAQQLDPSEDERLASGYGV